MDAFTMTTPVDEPAAVVLPTYADLESQITNLKQSLATSQNLREHWERKCKVYEQKVANVKGYFFDLYSENGRVEDEITHIAELLGITLTKEIAGTATYTISWTASVPLDFYAEDFEISFDVNCETYDAEDFQWNEDNCEVIGEDA